MEGIKKFLAMLVLISFSFCSLGSEIAFAAGRSAPPPRPGVRPPAPQPRPPQPRPPHPRPPRPLPPPPPPPPGYRHRPDYRYDWGYRDWGYRDHGRGYYSSRYEKIGFLIGAIALLGGILSSINTSEPTRKAPESSPPPTTLEEDLRAELSKTPVDKEKAMKIYMELRRKEQELAEKKFYDYLNSVK